MAPVRSGSHVPEPSTASSCAVTWSTTADGSYGGVVVASNRRHLGRQSVAPSDVPWLIENLPSGPAKARRSQQLLSVSDQFAGTANCNPWSGYETFR